MARDSMNDFGTIALTGSAQVVSGNVIDFGVIDDRASASTHRTGEQHDSTVVFSLAGALAATDSVSAPKLQHSDDNSAFTDLVTGPAIAAGAKKGTRILIPFPKTHKRYVRAAATPASSGTFTPVTMMAWIEPGPGQ
jgi:hypothetical protein